MAQRKPYQKSPFNLDGGQRIDSPYKLRLFYKRVHAAITDHHKSLAWLAKYAGHSKAWWGLAERDGQHVAQKKSGIVVRQGDYEAIDLIVKMLSDNTDEEDRVLKSRLGVMQAQSLLNERVNELVRAR